MQADLSGNFLYIYSGRNPKYMNPETQQTIYKLEDPFAKVQIIRIDKISNVEIDYKEENLKIYVSGMNYPIFCSFGERNCYRINCFYEFVNAIQTALQCDFDKANNLDKRNEQTGLSVQPSDVHD
jgi:hypothetical protein